MKDRQYVTFSFTNRKDALRCYNKYCDLFDNAIFIELPFPKKIGKTVFNFEVLVDEL